MPVHAAAFMEAVTHHALGKQEKSDCQDDKNRNLPISNQGDLCLAGVVVFELVVI